MLCDILKKYRELCDFSQQQVADCLKVNRSTYSYYELGKTEPSIENLRILSRLFGVPMNILLEADDDFHGGVQIVRDRPVIDIEDGRIDEVVGTRIGDLERDEKELILYYRMLTPNQRRDLLLSMQGRQGKESDNGDKS